MGHSGDGGSAGRSDDGGGSGRMDGFGGDGEGGHGFAERCECEITFEDATCQVGAADFEAMFPIPSDCENDLDYVTISTCADGTRRYHWLEAMENAYDVVIDAESGALLYGAAWGYVTSACGVTRVDHGAISFGPRPEESACTTTDICRTDGEGGAGGRRGSAG